MTEQRDYRDTVFLPKTDFPMKAGLPAKEPIILAKWQEARLYEKLREARRGREKFILHDGPPYANGDMHIGHALNHILKDMVVRTQSLLGKDAPYVPGWDCHGLPIEWKVEEAYRKKKLNKDEVAAPEFRAECRAYAQQWVDVQREQLKRLGINGDWDHPYLTMDPEAEGTIVAELMKFAESGQLYRGAKPVMWSPVEKTALAEAEVEYEDIVSTQIDVAFEIVESPISELVGAHAVIWTTTPWTIPVNQALAYGPEIEYVRVTLWARSLPNTDVDNDPELAAERDRLVALFNDRRIVIARDRLLDWLRHLDDQIRRYGVSVTPPMADNANPEDVSFVGSDLAGTIARHPIANHLRRPALDAGLGFSSADGAEGSQAPHQVRGDDWERMVEFFERPRPFLPGEFVTTEQGTGLVHMAPDHGEDDFELCKAHRIEPVFAVEGDGKYRADWAWLGGQGSVINGKFNAPDGPICSDLRDAGALLAASADYKHSYPHSWRSKAKVIFRATPQWFIPMDQAIAPPPPATQAVPLPEASSGSISPDQSSHSLLGEVAARSADGGATLRTTALHAIAATRWVPEKGQNRITAMVEGRPDWVISRQRAWGVPITLFVDRKTGQYLCDPEVNRRIEQAVREHGVDAWTDEAAQGFLGDAYNAADYERQTDILDVWFDSGCTHAFVLESGKWPDLASPAGQKDPPADLYLEGSDQHRGWFQSSLLESCGTRGRAPYKAVLTHGFTMDAKGMKMSKSLGNTINPIDLMKESGADILRLWALSVDFTEDHRIGKEILSGVSDQYRKLRNTFRYLLGALEGFSEDERMPVAEMPELERYVLHLLADMDAKLRQAVDDFDFNTYVRCLSDFANNDLSAFFFDIRKDSLYCDVATSPKRRAYRTVLDTLFHALVRYAAPVLVFTSEEVWATRFPDAESVHLLEWPAVDAGWSDALIAMPWSRVTLFRNAIIAAVEPLRRDKVIGSSLEAEVTFRIKQEFDARTFQETDLAELSIVASVILGTARLSDEHEIGFEATVTKTTHKKCGRCWRHLPEVTEDGALCGRCEGVVNA
jgi:isoleucyl-tRNA synthetase